ncbi:hypothetical protein REPUB_Repub13aG0062500 [Reevesia pubescens]
MSATSIKKIHVGFISLFLVTFILCNGFANAAEKKPTMQVMDSEMPHVGEFTPGMPLYRSRSNPKVLIPEYKLESANNRQ